MSLLSWITRRTPAAAVPPHAGMPRAEGIAKPAARPDEAGEAGNRKTERTAHREKLYVVVRESMNRAGLLSSSYKFKVLSLDKRGAQFLVMVDLAGRAGATAASLAAIETTIVQAAKARDGVAVTAVYWRQNEEVAAGLQAAAAARAPVKSVFEPIDADEVAAFKRALAAGTKRPAPAKAASGNLLLTGYEDTVLPDDTQRPRALSTSQYGDLT